MLDKFKEKIYQKKKVGKNSRKTREKIVKNGKT